MSPDQDREQPPAIVRLASRLTPRERAVAAATATLSVLSGYWIGVASVPDAALDVPKSSVSTRYGTEWDAAFMAVPDSSIWMTFIMLAAGAWVTWRAVRPVVEEGSA